MAAIDISGQKTGQAQIYWKQQIDGKQTLPDGTKTYSMRAMTDHSATVFCGGLFDGVMNVQN